MKKPAALVRTKPPKTKPVVELASPRLGALLSVLTFIPAFTPASIDCAFTFATKKITNNDAIIFFINQKYKKRPHLHAGVM